MAPQHRLEQSITTQNVVCCRAACAPTLGVTQKCYANLHCVTALLGINFYNVMSANVCIVFAFVVRFAPLVTTVSRLLAIAVVVLKPRW